MSLRRTFGILKPPSYCRHRFISSQTAHLDPLHVEQPDPAAHFEFFTKSLNWLLRHGAVQEKLSIRPDGYVRVKDIKQCWKFEYLSSSEFDDMLMRDQFRHFKMIQDFDIREGAYTAWIRARKSHTIKSVHTSVHQILSPSELEKTVYPVDLQGWIHARRHGVGPSPEDGFIHLKATVPNENLSHAVDTSFDVCIYFDTNKLLSNGIHIFETVQGGVLTTGDRDGVLPPYLFQEVVHLKLERETILDTSQ
ncbi:KptA family-domain-containing protein [Mycena crocata]|nr:KptA family-domain-containing protein [Mycena crocata]